MEDLPKSKQHELEQNYVKRTYDNISQDFSSTRYKKWPKVDAFLKSLSPSTLLLDVGCGNGKYLDNPSTINIGCDISFNLLRICKSRGFEVVQCDMLRLPFRSKTFDSIICIAALHHIVASKRRQACLEQIAYLMSPGSKFLVQVWSFEQELEQDNPYLKRNRLKSKCDEGPVREVMIEDRIIIPIHKNRTPFTNQDLLVPFHTKQSSSSSSTEATCRENVNQQLRYYHVFKQGELDSILEKIPTVVISESYYDRGNWCLIVEKKFDEVEEQKQS